MAGALAAMAIGTSCGPPGQAPAGTLLVLLSARTPEPASISSVAVHSGSGWTTLGSYSGQVPAAPGTATALEVRLPAGAYDGIRVGGTRLPIEFSVSAGQVEPILLGIAGGRPVSHGAYAGTAEVNRGLDELDGRLPQLPDVQLADQHGAPFSVATLAGRPAIVADFNTGCRETCPLYTGLFLGLRRALPSVPLVEVTTNPWQDTPAALRGYASRFGATWRLVTGAPAALTAFWRPFGVQLSRQDTQASELALIDAHGFIVKRFQGIPDLGGRLTPALTAYLNDTGRAQLHSHGQGWGLAQVVDAARGTGLVATARGGGDAPAFSARGWDGRSYSLASFGGRPLVINFWASWCVPCRTEMPLLQRAAGRHPEVAFLFVDEKDGRAAAKAFISGLGTRVTSPVASDPKGSVGDAFHVVNLPTTAFVRADGSLAALRVGQLDQTTLDDYLSALTG